MRITRDFVNALMAAIERKAEALAVEDHRQANSRMIICLKCTGISFSPNDFREGYCGWCHKFHTDVARVSIFNGSASIPRAQDGDEF